MGFNDFMSNLKNGNTPEVPRRIIEKITTQELLSTMKDEGYTCQTDNDGDIMWKLDGYKAIVVIGKSGNNIMFRIGFNYSDKDKIPLERINNWNRTKKYAVSFLDKDLDPVLECHLDMDGGITEERLVDFFKTCRHQFHAWEKEVLAGSDDDESWLNVFHILKYNYNIL